MEKKPLPVNTALKILYSSNPHTHAHTHMHTHTHTSLKSQFSE